MTEKFIALSLLLLLSGCDNSADTKQGELQNAKAQNAAQSSDVKESQRNIEEAAEAATRLVEQESREEIEGLKRDDGN